MAKKKVKKWKNKEWYPIQAPEMFEEKKIGQTPAEDEGKLKGKTIETSLRDITGKRSHSNMRIEFQVNEVEGGTAKTQIKGFNMSRDYIRKNIRKGRSIVRTVRDLKPNDETLHTTAYAFAIGDAHSSQEKKVREILDEKLDEEAIENDFESLLQKMIFGRTATDIFKEAKKILPIKRIEITKCEVKRGR